MAKCLNCGKEVNGKFCNTSCLNQYRAKQKRKEYEENPKVCQNCGKKLTWDQRRNKYCSQSCAASINNLGIKRNISGNNGNESKYWKLSDEDFIQAILNSNNWNQLEKNLGYEHTMSENTKSGILKRCENLNISFNIIEEIPIAKKTKGELFRDRSNYQSARSCIRKGAVKNFEKVPNNTYCYICGYNKHVDIAHIKAVSDFSDDTLIEVINDPSNLIPLCPNHHYEFDNGLMSKEDLDKIEEYKNNFKTQSWT